jgi:TolB-like protein/DNA-binding winged helix-turn-helix (wHTH) protein/Tfp pilus assembly protein PilF
MSQQIKHLYEFGPFRLDAGERLLLREGDGVPLTPKAFDLLLALVEHHGHLLEKDELLKKVWPDAFVEEANLSYNISLIRKTLGDGENGQRYIETVPKRGYRFMASVKQVAEGEAETLGSEPPKTLEITKAGERAARGGEAVTARTAPPVASPISRISRQRLAFGAITLALLALLGVGFNRLFWSVKAVDSLAVLPFVNGSADPQAEYLSDGITESLINNLSQLPDLKVIARTTAFRYKGKDIDPNKVGRELGVRAILMGRVVQRADALIIQADLVDAADGSQLWGEQYNRKPSDIFAVQEQLSREIVKTLRLRLSGRQQSLLTRRYTENTEAYHLYLKGRYQWSKFTAEGVKKGIEHFEQAIAKDPSYAQAYAGLADSYLALASPGIGLLSPSEAIPKAKAAAEKALELDETLAEAHVSLASVTDRWAKDAWATVEREDKRAIELNPNYALAHLMYGGYLSIKGRHDEAIAELKRALELDPLNLFFNSELGYRFHVARRYDEAIEQFRKTLEMDPNLWAPRQGLGWAYEQKGMYEEALAEYIKAKPLSGDSPEILAMIGRSYAVLGKRDEAQKVIDELKERAKRGYVSASLIALIYAGLGEKDQTFAWLEKAYEDRDGWIPWINVDPRYDGIRSDPRFTDLVRRIGLVP